MATCISCKGEYDKEHPAECPRCGANNSGWEKAKTTWFGVYHFFLSNPWGILAIILFFSPILAPLAINFTPVASERIGIPLALVQSEVLILLIYALRRTLWEYEWARQVKKGWRPSLTIVAVVLFNLGIVMALTVGFALEGTRATTTGFARAIFTIAFALTFINLVFSGLLMASRSFARALDELVPQPIFAYEERFIKLIIKQVKEKIQLAQGTVPPMETKVRMIIAEEKSEFQASVQEEKKKKEQGVLNLVAMERTDRGGAKLLLTYSSEPKAISVKGSDKRVIVQEEQTWEVEADEWARLLSVRRKGVERLVELKPEESGNAAERPIGT